LNSKNNKLRSKTFTGNLGTINLIKA